MSLSGLTASAWRNEGRRVISQHVHGGCLWIGSPADRRGHAIVAEAPKAPRQRRLSGTAVWRGGWREGRLVIIAVAILAQLVATSPPQVWAPGVAGIGVLMMLPA